jgi:hypothetical protein
MKKDSSRQKPAMSEDDRETILEETGHLPDRDQLFEDGQKTLPSSLTPPTGDQWIDEDDDWAEAVEPEVVGSSDAGRDAVDDLEHALEDTRGARKLPAEEDKTPAVPAEGEDIERLSLAELTRRGAALGVAGRGEMGRHQLIAAIREAMDRE